jgi:hypothetical protein
MSLWFKLLTNRRLLRQLFSLNVNSIRLISMIDRSVRIALLDNDYHLLAVNTKI